MSLLILDSNYRISYQRSRELEALQCWFRDTKLAMLVDCKYNRYEFMLRRQKLANRLKDKFQLLHGGSGISCEYEISSELG